MSLGASFSDRPLAIKQAGDTYAIHPWQHHHAALTTIRQADPGERDELLDMLGLDLDEAHEFERATYPEPPDFCPALVPNPVPYGSQPRMLACGNELHPGAYYCDGHEHITEGATP